MKSGLKILIGLIACLPSFCLHASMWMDPDWEQMLKDSELIALVQVIDGGRDIAKVKPLTVFKGDAAAPFYVTGYYNNHWPAKIAAKEAFKGNQRYYIFLRRENDPVELQILEEEAKATGNTDLKRKLKEAARQRIRFVWTPSAGDLLVEGEKVHYSLLRTSYPLSSPARDRAWFERFLKAAIAFQVEAKPDTALIDKSLQEIRSEVGRTSDSPGEENQLAHSLASYFLLGGRAYDEIFEKVATGNNDYARLMLARLLGAISDHRAHKLLLTMLDDKNSVVQGEVVRQLAKNHSEQVGEVLLKRLNDAGELGVYPHGIMDPVRNELPSGKVEIIRALGELKYEPAIPALLQVVQSATNGYSLQVALEALEEMGKRNYAPALAKALQNPELVREIATWVNEHNVKEMKPALEQWLEQPPPEAGGGPVFMVIDALGKIGDDTTAAKLTAHLQKMTSRQVPEFFEDGYTGSLFKALAGLRYAPAREPVERSFFLLAGF